MNGYLLEFIIKSCVFNCTDNLQPLDFSTHTAAKDLRAKFGWCYEDKASAQLRTTEAKFLKSIRLIIVLYVEQVKWITLA